MMDTITLTKDRRTEITLLPNDFIDHHMAKADGEYVKIYLMVLRLAGQGLAIHPDQLADSLELTRKDVLRALHYWENEGLLTLGTGAGETADEPPASRPAADPVRIPVRKTRDVSELAGYIKGTDLDRVVFMAETYMGHPLSSAELNSICYISNDLHFSTDLLEYLVEYCTEKGKKQMRYIEKVAVNWYGQGIDTVQKAMEQTALYTQNVFSVMKAFGISGRQPGQSEIDYITRWNAMGFGNDIIVEACNRTLLTTHQASFPYANRILEGWKKAGVMKLADISSIDQKHHARRQAEQAQSGTGRANASPVNAFHNFEQRSYDYDALESRLTGTGRR